jgi:hypothetical protein
MGSERGVIERSFDALIAGDWASFAALLSPEVERIGPGGDRVVGREPYVQQMASGQSPSDKSQQPTKWDVHCIAYTADRRSAFARVTAHVTYGGRDLRVEETLAYRIDADWLISHIEVFMQDPRYAEPRS